ncbi:uncharacterized protein RAG0_08670 [Rhynchosporium agropyri]|uniref:Uncharacterized protein n=1 Tax=Rhynchosporium agropyri TaxID=914238 RepID=A0A1E1KRX0_9HELO|nr:uncharacterized protein RAG0_08670 [Rhynchosporium agropyri]
MSSLDNTERSQLSQARDKVHEPFGIFTMFAELPPELRWAIFEQVPGVSTPCHRFRRRISTPRQHPAEEIGRIQHLRIPDWSALSANAKVAAVFSKSTGLTQMTIVLIDDAPDRIIHASPEQTFAYAKAKHGWVPPQYDLEVFGASQRISSGLEAM